MKKLLSTIVSIALLASAFSFSALAAPAVNDAEVTIDLSHEGTQSQSFYDENGEPCTLTVEVKPKTQARKTDPVPTGDSIVTVKYTAAVINTWFTMDVSQPKIGSAVITDAYDEGYMTIGSTVSEDTLTVNRSKETASSPAKASYKVSYNVVGDIGSFKKTLSASIKSGKLTMKTN